MTYIIYQLSYNIHSIEFYIIIYTMTCLCGAFVRYTTIAFNYNFIYFFSSQFRGVSLFWFSFCLFLFYNKIKINTKQVCLRLFLFINLALIWVASILYIKGWKWRNFLFPILSFLLIRLFVSYFDFIVICL